MRKVLSFLLVLMCCSVATFAVINVPADYPDIQAAIDAAAEGDTIVVAAGSYPGFTLSGATGITLQAEDGVIVEGRIGIRNCTGCILEGFSVTSLREGILVSGCNTDLTLKGLTVTGCAGDGIRISDTPEECSNTGIVISDCTVSNNGGNGITVLCTTEIDITDNTINENDVNGIYLAPCTSGSVTGNTLRGNGFAAVHPS